MRAHATPGGSMFLRITHRLVTQAEQVWIVRESDDSLGSRPAAPTCLVCESDQTVRRARDYPADWNRLSDSELMKLFG